MKHIVVLGSSGSIGQSTLDVLKRHPERFRVWALSAHSRMDVLQQQCLEHHPRYAVTDKAHDAQSLQAALKQAGCATEVLHGAQSLADIAAAPEVDGVMAAIVGAAGLLPALAAARAGKTIYLANKEALVVAGRLFMQAARAGGAKILPVDSEHNAIFQVLPRDFNGELAQHGIDSIILTASGGPFLHTDLAEFAHITPERAVKHPNWSMGRKISIDSATMMNKGLELIEAHWLFQAPANQLEVVIHPQSVIHSMVRYKDGSVLAQMGAPDMRTPIAYCLGLPERIASGVKALDFSQINALTFHAPDTERFPCLKLAYEALAQDNDAACVLNAANEMAVEAFLNRQIRFTDIASLVAHVLNAADLQASTDLAALMEKDRAARLLARHHLKRFQAA